MALFVALCFGHAFVWPLGSALDMGEWISVPRVGKHGGGQRFVFGPEYEQFGYLFHLAFLLAVGFLTSLFAAPRPPGRNGGFASVPHCSSARELLNHLSADKILYQYESVRELSWTGQFQRALAMPLISLLGLAAAAVTNGNLADQGPTPERIAVVVAFQLPAALCLGHALRLRRRLRAVDDRLLIDIQSRQFLSVDMADPSGAPMPLCSFDQIREVVLERKVGRRKRRSRDDVRVLAHRKGPGEPICMLDDWRQTTDADELAGRLAELLGVPLRRAEIVVG